MKRSYHTDIIVQYKLGLLPKELLKDIPSSTLDNWKRRDLNELYGIDYIDDLQKNFDIVKKVCSTQSLLKAAKSLYYIYSAYSEIVSKLQKRNPILRESMTLIISTIDKVKENIGLKRAINAFRISPQQYYAWKNKTNCILSPIKTCRKRYYNQLTNKELDVIKKYLKDPKYLHWNITPVFYQILRDKAAFFSRTTFYKYVRILKLERARQKKKNYDTGIRAQRPKQILHADVTILKTLDNSKVYIYLLVDNFSRFILNWKASTSYSANITFDNLKESYEEYDLEKINPVVDLITDGGSENKGQVEHYINQDHINIQKIVAQLDIKFSNSMVEAVNKRIKYDYLFSKRLYSLADVLTYLKTIIEEYNNKPHSSLFGLTPKEVFDGCIHTAK